MYEFGGKVCVIGGLVVWFEVDSLKGISEVKSTFVYVCQLWVVENDVVFIDDSLTNSYKNLNPP